MHRFDHADLTLLAGRPATQTFAQDTDDNVLGRLESRAVSRPFYRAADESPFKISKTTERGTRSGYMRGSNSRSSRTHDAPMVSPQSESNVAQSASEDSDGGLVMPPAIHKCTQSGCRRKFVTLESLKYVP
jgi:hypothetical protein